MLMRIVYKLGIDKNWGGRQREGLCSQEEDIKTDALLSRGNLIHKFGQLWSYQQNHLFGIECKPGAALSPSHRSTVSFKILAKSR